MTKHYDRIGFLFPMLLLTGIATAQGAYFQQEVNYRIEVTLDDTAHTLTGTIGMDYHNHSPDALPFLWFHLWSNAYRDRTTALARQFLRSGNDRFYFAGDEELGGISGLDFRVDGNPARLEPDPANPDLARLFLNRPLASGDSIHITTPFQVKIPASFSRLGHVGQSYQVTQWYPKPAVYDASGWHPMPYLDQGEFYAEFGRFEVSITLPENYVVGATGVLETESEKDFLQQKAAETDAFFEYPGEGQESMDPDSFPPSASRMKTIRYTAGQVHDFAWFADKRFHVRNSRVTLASGRQVDTWVMFTDEEALLWKDAAGYVDRALQFYSEKVGEYPYPQATAVQSALSAGGGMEYPMITVIGLMSEPQDLDEVIAHEVGHNWFYGILAFNERDHPWLDEGINSYYEHRYSGEFYGGISQVYLPEFLLGDTSADIQEIGYVYQARRRRDQAPDTPSDAFPPINYWLGAYEKPARGFRLLEKYLGTGIFDRLMQDFYRQWQFRHPQPADLRRHLETGSGKDLSWLFDGLLGSNDHTDYSVTGLRRAEDEDEWIITIRNRGEVAAPFPLCDLVDGRVEHTQWVEGFTGVREILFPDYGTEEIAIDPQRWTLDVNRKNNYSDFYGLFRTIPPLRLRFLGKVGNDRFNDLYWLPAPGWNAYDRFMPGLVLHNRTVPSKTFEFSLTPMYAFGSRRLGGLGNAFLHFFPRRGPVQEVRPGLTGRSFTHDHNDLTDTDLNYRRLEPSLTLELRKSPASLFSQTLTWRSIFLGVEELQFSREGDFLGKDRQEATIHELCYRGVRESALNPFSYLLALEQQRYTDVFGQAQHYLKASLDWRNAFTYAHARHIRVRLFAGAFIDNTARERGAIFPGAFNLISQGYNDYRFDDFYFGRNAGAGLWSQQVTLRDGGFRVPAGPAYTLGRSNSFIVALNLKADLPGKIPLRPYFDIGFFDNAMPTGKDDTLRDQLLWNGGMALELAGGKIGIYLPVISSGNLRDILSQRGNYWSRIGFRLELYEESPWDFIERSLTSGGL